MDETDKPARRIGLDPAIEDIRAMREQSKLLRLESQQLRLQLRAQIEHSCQSRLQRQKVSHVANDT